MAIRGRGLWTQLGTADNHTSAQTLEVGLQCGRTACASHGVARTHSEYVPASFICQGSRARYWGVRWNFRIQGSVISSELSLQGSYMYVVREYWVFIPLKLDCLADGYGWGNKHYMVTGWTSWRIATLHIVLNVVLKWELFRSLGEVFANFQEGQVIYRWSNMYAAFWQESLGEEKAVSQFDSFAYSYWKSDSLNYSSDESVAKKIGQLTW